MAPMTTLPQILPPPTTRWGDFGSGKSIPQLVSERARTNPERIAINDLSAGVQLSYADLEAAARRWAGALGEAGVAPGDAVVMLVPNHAESYAMWLGISWLRAIAVPVNIQFRGAMLRHVVELSRARVAIVAGDLVQRLDDLADQLSHLQTIILNEAAVPAQHNRWTFVSREDALSAEPTAGDPPGWTDPSVVIFTGGTTGPSKGALVQWGYWHTYGDLPPVIQGENCRIYSPWPVWHSSGQYGLSNSVYRNGTLVLRERFHTQRFWPDVRAADVTGTMLLGGVANLLWQAEPLADDRDNPMQHMSIQPMVMDHRAFEERFDVKVQSGYGMSEAGTVLLSQWPLPNGRTCGVATPGFEARLVDGDGQDVAAGEVGELWLRTEDPAQMFIEYLNMPAESAAARTDGWFRTGDAFTRDEHGFFYFQDRLKDCIRRRGENISSLELEREINAFDPILESAAVAVRDETGGEEVLVFVVCQPGRSATPEELIAFLEPRLPRFMVPRYVEYIDALPKTPASGRVRKLELRARGLGQNTWDRERA
jgi:carnitine-CoA ligase